MAFAEIRSDSCRAAFKQHWCLFECEERGIWETWLCTKEKQKWKNIGCLRAGVRRGWRWLFKIFA
ncbi:unnamed product [Ostreococcus tauri]|uniref:Unnamed product n=1 Tax=Ostreococcus tauri TaxID=70448 RepID=A0A090M629_OSTTA|nr:unnamed product [Ostreococcus tauri]CEF97574.1 unnamed product [Ostreococcus tauri]|eukprot:XP_022838764.1 unnamed product [Ostreococcus tauri]